MQLAAGGRLPAFIKAYPPPGTAWPEQSQPSQRCMGLLRMPITPIIFTGVFRQTVMGHWLFVKVSLDVAICTCMPYMRMPAETTGACSCSLRGLCSPLERTPRRSCDLAQPQPWGVLCTHQAPRLLCTHQSPTSRCLVSSALSPLPCQRSGGSTTALIKLCQEDSGTLPDSGANPAREAVGPGE